VATDVAAFTFVGGVQRRLVIDNLRTGVDRADLYDPKLNRAYAPLRDVARRALGDHQILGDEPGTRP
jgi:transposase